MTLEILTETGLCNFRQHCSILLSGEWGGWWQVV